MKLFGVAWMVVVVTIGCGSESDRDPHDGGGTAASADGSTGPATTSGPSPTSAADAGATGSDPCAGISPSQGEPCSTPGAQCSYADDCGSAHYLCENGVWVADGASTCGQDTVACKDGPSQGDACSGQEICDPDNDCVDVLQCEFQQWILREVCSAEYCVDVTEGGACDEIDRVCPYPCGLGETVYQCTPEGWDSSNLGC